MSDGYVDGYDDGVRDSQPAIKRLRERITALELALKDACSAWKELTGRDYEPAKHLLIGK